MGVCNRASKNPLGKTPRGSFGSDVFFPDTSVPHLVFHPPLECPHRSFTEDEVGRRRRRRSLLDCF